MKFDNLFKLPPRKFGPPMVPYYPNPKEIPNLFWINFIKDCSQCRALTGWRVALPDVCVDDFPGGDEVMICSTECLNAFVSKSGDASVEDVKT